MKHYKTEEERIVNPVRLSVFISDDMKHKLAEIAYEKSGPTERVSLCAVVRGFIEKGLAEKETAHE